MLFPFTMNTAQLIFTHPYTKFTLYFSDLPEFWNTLSNEGLWQKKVHCNSWKGELGISKKRSYLSAKLGTSYTWSFRWSFMLQWIVLRMDYDPLLTYYDRLLTYYPTTLNETNQASSRLPTHGDQVHPQTLLV